MLLCARSIRFTRMPASFAADSSEDRVGSGALLAVIAEGGMFASGTVATPAPIDALFATSTVETSFDSVRTRTSSNAWVVFDESRRVRWSAEMVITSALNSRPRKPRPLLYVVPGAPR